MKQKVTITGPKVHDVGYRYLLIGGAMNLHLPGFDALNLTAPSEQAVEALMDGKDNQVTAFVDFVKNNKPANAIVSNIAISDCDGDVTRIGEYAQVLTAMQMLKAIEKDMRIVKTKLGIR